ncbi:MAG: hypothetical protein HXJ92_02250 [candidate division SR1 bacterium]|nr:hypothetical protein [candidate division SR1 bacterium]
MELVLLKISKENQLRNSDFSSDFLATFRDLPYYEQRLMKYSLLQTRWGADEKTLLKSGQEYVFGGEYFSASYSSDWLALAFGEQKIGIDIEVIKERSKVLLEKYSEELQLFGAESWHNFYLLRTAKEALLKKVNGIRLDLIEGMKVIKVEPAFDLVIDKITLQYKGENYQVFSTIDHEKAISIAL